MVRTLIDRRRIARAMLVACTGTYVGGILWVALAARFIPAIAGWILLSAFGLFLIYAWLDRYAS